MGAIYNALKSLSRVQDAEVLEGYQRYETLLSEVLTPEQMDIYARLWDCPLRHWASCARRVIRARFHFICRG